MCFYTASALRNLAPSRKILIELFVFVNFIKNITRYTKTLLKRFPKGVTVITFTIENLQEAVFWVSSQGNILQVNERACELTGYSKEDLLCKEYWILILLM